MLDKVSGSMTEYWLTLGECDSVALFHAPDDETMARIMLEIGRLGAVRTQTKRAFGEQEYREILARLD